MKFPEAIPNHTPSQVTLHRWGPYITKVKAELQRERF